MWRKLTKTTNNLPLAFHNQFLAPFGRQKRHPHLLALCKVRVRQIRFGRTLLDASPPPRGRQEYGSELGAHGFWELHKQQGRPALQRSGEHVSQTGAIPWRPALSPCLEDLRLQFARYDRRFAGVHPKKTTKTTISVSDTNKTKKISFENFQ